MYHGEVVIQHGQRRTAVKSTTFLAMAHTTMQPRERSLVSKVLMPFTKISQFLRLKMYLLWQSVSPLCLEGSGSLRRMTISSMFHEI